MEFKMSIILNIPQKFKDLCILGGQSCEGFRGGHVIYSQKIKHKGLNEKKEIVGNTKTLPKKLSDLLIAWDKKYQAEIRKQEIEKNKERAIQETAVAQEHIASLEMVLINSLAVSNVINWNKISSKQKYKEEKFPKLKPSLIEQLEFKKPLKPKTLIFKFNEKFPEFVEPEVGFFDKLFRDKQRIITEARDHYNSELSKYEKRKAAAQKKHNVKNKKIETDYENALQSVLKKQDEQNQLANQNRLEILKWEKENESWQRKEAHKRIEFRDNQQKENERIRKIRTNWEQGVHQAIVDHAALVLSVSEYPDWISGNYLVQYDPENKLLKVQFELPNKSVVDAPKAVKFVATTGQFVETKLSLKEQKALYDNLCYQLALRSVHELFEADVKENINSILFNGSVSYIDPANGKDTVATIMSAIFERTKFQNLNLKQIDPKACFKSFKGVSASTLIGLVPIPPVMDMDKTDNRFIDSRIIRNQEVDGVNLAAMDWEDFEHLVREIFDKEFAARGGEVRVTQSSSDGGVDAVAFDPDPISGGKIVIQAKRYTKTVGVSAVRDLYGTTMNEGASKGILVTTADYGPDAYKFASDKPITLMNGSHLLHLMERHGMNAKIDLLEARKQLGLSEAMQNKR